MKTELGYDVSGPDSQGELEVADYGSPRKCWADDTVYLTHADLVAMLALYDEVEEQADEEVRGVMYSVAQVWLDEALEHCLNAPWVARDPTQQELADAAQQAVRAFWKEREDLANEVVDLHARLRAYENTAGELTRARRLEDLLEEAIDTLQWLAAGQEVVYAHDVDVVARGLRDGLGELSDAP